MDDFKEKGAVGALKDGYRGGRWQGMDLDKLTHETRKL